MRKLCKAFSCFSLALCLIIGSAFCSEQAAAQAVKHGSAAGAKKEVKFEVISIHLVKPGWSPYDGKMPSLSNTEPTPVGFETTMTVWQMLMLAYAPGDIHSWEGVPMTGAPKWLSNIPPELYVIKAHVSEADQAAWRNQSGNHELLRSAMQDLLKQRCKLVAHQEPTELPDYKLVIGKKGLKMKALIPGAPLPKGGSLLPSGGVRSGEIRGGLTVWHYYGATIGDLVDFLGVTSRLRPVHDETRLTGRYDFTLRMIDDSPSDQEDQVRNWPIAQLGLELRPGKYLGFKLVIDHLEKPTDNN